MKQLFIAITCTCLLAPLHIHAQYHENGNFYLGLGYGKGSMHGTEQLSKPSPTAINNGYLNAHASTWGMSMLFSHLSDRDEGLCFGYLLAFNLGAATTKWKHQSAAAPKSEPKEVEELNYYTDIKIGGQLAYKWDSHEAFAGLRYYLNLQADGLRGPLYGNADDAACI